MLINKPNRTQSDEIVWFVDHDLYDSQKYNFDYYIDKYGPKDENASTYNFSLWSRLGPEFSNSGSDNKYSVIPTEQQLGYFVDYYIKKYGDDVKFDLWIPDVSLVSVWSNGTKTSQASNFYRLFQHTEKINIISDGNWQTLNLVTNAVNRLNKKDYQQMSDQEIKEKIDLFKNDKDFSLFSEFKQNNIYDYLHYEKLISVFHTKSYTDSPFYKYPEGMELYKAHSIDYDYVSMASKMLPNDTNKEKQKQYVLDYESFFNIQNNKSINDFVWKNIEKYDPKKKNIIWMGDSLIRPDANGNEIYRYPEKQKEINAIVQSYVNKFPLDEYNYFVKHHPSFDKEYQQNLNQYLFKDIIDPICLNPFPWEVFLSWDHKMQLADNTYSPFFNQDSNKESTPKTKIVGVQYTTTTIQTTAFYLQNTYNMSLDDVEKSVGISDWPIPETFDIVTRTTSFAIDPKQQYKINLKKIEDIYLPFIQLNIFPNYSETSLPVSDYAQINGVDYDIMKYIQDVFENRIWTISIIIPTFLALIILISLITTIIIWAKKYKNNISK